VAALSGFGPGFEFPPAISAGQRYALLGNSLSVDVVAALLWHLLLGMRGGAAGVRAAGRAA
jgi:hypothetical protein